jgi:hypothetical protein
MPLNACSPQPSRTTSSPSCNARPVLAYSATILPLGFSNVTSAAIPTPVPATRRHRPAPSVADRAAVASPPPIPCRVGNCKRQPGRSSGNASRGGVRPVGSLFFPLDQRLHPRLLRKIVRQGGKASSFQEAAEDLQELAELTISPSHVRRSASGSAASGSSGSTGKASPINKTNCHAATRRRRRWPP